MSLNYPSALLSYIVRVMAERLSFASRATGVLRR
jgi:hypothetical protein